MLSISLVLAASAAHARPSNPAFLGIGMSDLGGNARAGGARGPCLVESITRGSGAKAAGLQPGDQLQTIDGEAVANCDAVLKAVQSHEAGDVVTIGVQRFGRLLSLNAQLVSRDEILRRRLVGQPIAATDLWGIEDGRSYDLSSLRGKTAIVGFYDVRRCDGCNRVFSKVASWARAQADRSGIQPMPLAVTVGDRDRDTAKSILPASLDVPLALADAALYEEFTIPDSERIHFMIVDCRGVVQYVAPIAPNADDTAAVLDELFAAAEQASRRPN